MLVLLFAVSSAPTRDVLFADMPGPIPDTPDPIPDGWPSCMTARGLNMCNVDDSSLTEIQEFCEQACACEPSLSPAECFAQAGPEYVQAIPEELQTPFVQVCSANVDVDEYWMDNYGIDNDGCCLGMDRAEARANFELAMKDVSSRRGRALSDGVQCLTKIPKSCGQVAVRFKGDAYLAWHLASGIYKLSSNTLGDGLPVYRQQANHANTLFRCYRQENQKSYWVVANSEPSKVCPDVHKWYTYSTTTTSSPAAAIFAAYNAGKSWIKGQISVECSPCACDTFQLRLQGDALVRKAWISQYKELSLQDRDGHRVYKHSTQNGYLHWCAGSEFQYWMAGLHSSTDDCTGVLHSVHNSKSMCPDDSNYNRFKLTGGTWVTTQNDEDITVTCSPCTCGSIKFTGAESTKIGALALSYTVVKPSKYGQRKIYKVDGGNKVYYLQPCAYFNYKDKYHWVVSTSADEQKCNTGAILHSQATDAKGLPVCPEAADFTRFVNPSSNQWANVPTKIEVSC